MLEEQGLEERLEGCSILPSKKQADRGFSGRLGIWSKRVCMYLILAGAVHARGVFERLRTRDPRCE